MNFYNLYNHPWGGLTNDSLPLSNDPSFSQQEQLLWLLRKMQEVIKRMEEMQNEWEKYTDKEIIKAKQELYNFIEALRIDLQSQIDNEHQWNVDEHHKLDVKIDDLRLDFGKFIAEVKGLLTEFNGKLKQFYDMALNATDAKIKAYDVKLKQWLNEQLAAFSKMFDEGFLIYDAWAGQKITIGEAVKNKQEQLNNQDCISFAELDTLGITWQELFIKNITVGEWDDHSRQLYIDAHQKPIAWIPGLQPEGAFGKPQYFTKDQQIAQLETLVYTILTVVAPNFKMLSWKEIDAKGYTWKQIDSWGQPWDNIPFAFGW